MAHRKIKVLILSYYFPPMGGVGVQRVVNHIKYLPEFGFEPVVLTANYGGKHKMMDTSLMDTDYLRDCKIYRRGGDKLHQYLEGREGSGVSRFFGHIRLLRYLPYMDIYSAWSNHIVADAIDIARQENVDLVYSTSPPHSTHILASRIKQELDIPWVMELRDSMSEWPLRRPGMLTALLGRIESFYESRFYNYVDGIIFVTEFQRKHAIERCPTLKSKRTAVITNGFGEETSALSVDDPDLDLFRIVYTGSLADFNIQSFCAGLKQAVALDVFDGKTVELCIVGTVDPANRRILLELSTNIRVKFAGVVTHGEALEFQASADCLLLLQTANYQNRGSEILTGKVFEYIVTRKPILAVAIEGELSSLIEENDFGVSVAPDSADKIASAISHVVVKASDEDWVSRRRKANLYTYSRAAKARETTDFLIDVVGNE